MSKARKEIVNLCAKSGQFQHIICVKNIVYLFNKFDEVTAFCSPKLQRMNGLSIIDIYYGLIFIKDGGYNIQTCKAMIENKLFFAKLMPIDISLFDEMLIRDGAISRTMLDIMSQYMAKYTVENEIAKRVFSNENDSLIYGLKRLYKDRLAL